MWPAAAQPQLKYVVIVTRHGVRSPTWDSARLNEYSAQAWPDWKVAPGYLTSHGREAIKLLGTYYAERFTKEGLLDAKNCRDAPRLYIWADTDQRTIETGKALAESMLPGCDVETHSQPQNNDPVFSGHGASDPKLAAEALRARLGPDPRNLLAGQKPALDLLQFILDGGKATTRKLIAPPAEISVSTRGKTAELQGPLSIGSTMSENLLLEYANGFEGNDLGWGRLTKENLLKILEIHGLYADLMRRTNYLAQVRGSNLLSHVLRSLEQASSGKPVPGALGHPGDKLLVLSGHDTNLSNISGMLNLSWGLPGYQKDETPPGGALIVSLWRDSSGAYSIRSEYLAQSLDQMRNLTALTSASPVLRQDVAIPGCEGGSAKACSFATFRAIVEKAINPAFVED